MPNESDGILPDIAQINNGSKYRNPYESSIPSDEVWENGTSKTLMDILKTIGSDRNHLLIMEETSVNKLKDPLKHLIFSEEKRIPLFLPSSNLRGYVSTFGSATILVVQSYHVFTGLGDHCLRSNKARIERAANYTAVAYALYQAGIISYESYNQLRRRMMSFAIEIEGLNGTPTWPNGSHFKACQNVTGLGHCINPIRAGVRAIGHLLSSTPGMCGNNEFKPIGMPDVYVGALMKQLGRRRFDKLVSILLPGLQPERDMGAFLEQMRRQGTSVIAARSKKRTRDNMDEEARLDAKAAQRARYASLTDDEKRKRSHWSTVDCYHCGGTYQCQGKGIRHVCPNVINESKLECRQICQETEIVDGVTWRCGSEKYKDPRTDHYASLYCGSEKCLTVSKKREKGWFCLQCKKN